MRKNEKDGSYDLKSQEPSLYFATKIIPADIHAAAGNSFLRWRMQWMQAGRRNRSAHSQAAGEAKQAAV